MFSFPDNYPQILQICLVGVAIFNSCLQGNRLCYDAHFCCANTWHIDVPSGKKLDIFISITEILFFWKIIKAIVHGSLKKRGFRIGNKILQFFF